MAWCSSVMTGTSRRKVVESMMRFYKNPENWMYNSQQKKMISSGTRTVRGSSSKESFFSEGKNEPGGLLFNESPPGPGSGGRQWESWEGPWYFTFGAATAILSIGLSAKPDTSLVSWAEREAKKRQSAA